MKDLFETGRARPIIMVSGPDRGGWPAWFFTRISVWLAGGRARRMTPRVYSLSAVLNFDGLILGGGADIDPSLYGESLLQGLQIVHHGARPKRRYIAFSIFSVFIYALRFIFSSPRHTGFRDQPRDTMEWDLLDKAFRKGLPVLGICRGCQLINVYFKGSLHQDIREFYTEYPQYRSIFPRKVIHVKRTSRLFQILHRERCLVNALHNQSVSRLADELEVVACEPNGIIQAIEPKRKSIAMLGVQWHPEYLLQKREQRLLFHWLVQLAMQRTYPESLRTRSYAH